MIFYSSLFYFLFLLNKLFATDLFIRDECTVLVQTDDTKAQKCLNTQCYIHKNPWQILRSYDEDKRDCYFHYLNLSFTDYDYMKLFADAQSSSPFPVDTFFVRSERRNCLLEIDIEDFFPRNRHELLQEHILNQLGRKDDRINIIRIEIHRWHYAFLNESQIFERDFIDEQPFDEVIIRFICNRNNQWMMVKLYRKFANQPLSPCPTQILIKQKHEGREIHEEHHDDDEDEDEDDLPTANNWNLFAKIGIVFLVIILIIFCIVTQLICRRGQNRN